MCTCKQSHIVFRFTIIGLLALRAANASAADDDPIQEPSLDPVLLKQLVTQDALLIQYLHIHSCSELLKNLGIKTDNKGLAVGRFQRKKLAFQSRYTTKNGQCRIVFVYDPTLHIWPGSQPETIVISDSTYRLIAWKEVGGSPMFEQGQLTFDDSKAPTLILTCRHRHTFTHPKVGRYRFLLSNDVIKEAKEVEWIYSSEEAQAEYERIRQVLEAKENSGT